MLDRLSMLLSIWVKFLSTSPSSCCAKVFICRPRALLASILPHIISAFQACSQRMTKEVEKSVLGRI